MQKFILSLIFNHLNTLIFNIPSYMKKMHKHFTHS